MLELSEYDRHAAIEYAHRWAYFRNPAYYNFEYIGGDCTNFASQCLYAGSGLMNYTPVYGWYYKNVRERSPAWTGVNYFYSFIVSNKGQGPFGCEVSVNEAEPGDFVQFSSQGDRYHHTPIITYIKGAPSLNTIYVAAHSSDCDCRPLASYMPIRRIRFIHIEGVRKTSV